MLANKVRELAKPFGGVSQLTVLERVRIETSATLLLRRPRGHEDVIRYANAIDRLLRFVERSRARRKVPKAKGELAHALVRGP